MVTQEKMARPNMRYRNRPWGVTLDAEEDKTWHQVVGQSTAIAST
jgi:hypothetical protein